MKLSENLERILQRSARPVAIQCSEAQGTKLEKLGLAKIVSRNPTPFVEITDLGRIYISDGIEGYISRAIVGEISSLKKELSAKLLPKEDK